MVTRKAGGLVVALVAFATIGSAAMADDADVRPANVRVKRAAVVPASVPEAQRSLDRLGSAAMEACGASFHSLPDHQYAVRHSACWHDSMREVVTRIDNPYLTAAFQRRASVEVAASEGGSSAGVR